MKSGNLKHQIVSIIYPPACCICDREMSSTVNEADICGDCLAEITGNLIDRCPKCGAADVIIGDAFDHCVLCRSHDFRFSRAVAIGNYRGLLQENVIRLKREHCEVTAMQFGRLLANQLEKFEIEQIDLIVPIPIHWWKRLRRGFHAADVVAEGIRMATGFRKSNRALRCTRQTEKQGKLTHRQRFANLKGAFTTGRTRVTDLTILLVDDVMTSGATIDQASRVLLNAGAAKVFAACAARGARVS